MSEEEQRERELARRRQDAIDATLLACKGQPLDVIESRLVKELAERDVPRPPDPWVESVAVEIRADRVYVASPDAARGDPVVERRHARGEF